MPASTDATAAVERWCPCAVSASRRAAITRITRVPDLSGGDSPCPHRPNPVTVCKASRSFHSVDPAGGDGVRKSYPWLATRWMCSGLGPTQ